MTDTGKTTKRVSGFIAPFSFRRGPNPQARVTPKGTRYADVLIEDASGNYLTVKVWEEDAERADLLRPGNFIVAQGPYQENQGERYTFREVSARFLRVVEGCPRGWARNDGAPDEVAMTISLEDENAEI